MTNYNLPFLSSAANEALNKFMADCSEEVKAGIIEGLETSHFQLKNESKETTPTKGLASSEASDYEKCEQAERNFIEGQYASRAD